MADPCVFSVEQLSKLRVAAEWVIPTDNNSPGAGSDVCVYHLQNLIGSLGSETAELYRHHLPGISEEDLNDASHPFAQIFIDHVRDVYYGYSDTGAWEDIGFAESQPS